jgi:hypothetical protein
MTNHRITFAVSGLLLFSIGCKLLTPNEEVPNGTSSITAKIQGVADTLSNIITYEHLGYFAYGEAGQYAIRLHLGNGDIGQHAWGTTPGFSNDSLATLNWYPSIPRMGGFTIALHHKGLRLIQGTFSFSVFDTSKVDTITVQDGSFTLYYVRKD